MYRLLLQDFWKDRKKDKSWKMVKTIIKGFIILLTFVISLFVIEQFMNKDRDNMTTEIAQASLPLIWLQQDEQIYNRMIGYAEATDVAFQRDHVTVLSENREGFYVINTFGRGVNAIGLEVRSVDGSRLIESSELKNYDVIGTRITGSFVLKDLIEQNEEYALILKLTLGENKEIRYYTRVIWGKDLHEKEKINFTMDFHKKLFQREEAKELTKYLETNHRLESNSTFYKVNIHSSFKQLTWGDLEVEEVGEPAITLKDITPQTAAILLDYRVETLEEESRTLYDVQEYYRVKYSPDRMYLLDYERTMTQIPDVNDMCANDKILLGIADTDVDMMESVDGNVVAFEAAGRLYSYNTMTNRLAILFSFYDSVNDDERAFVDQHQLKVLDIDEAGNVDFAVCGYMNRGRHEGTVGIQIYTYSSTLNTIEERIFIPYDKSYSVLKNQLKDLLYMNRDGKLYIDVNNAIYLIDLQYRGGKILTQITGDDMIQVSEDHHVLVWLDGDSFHAKKMSLRNLTTDTQTEVSVGADEAIRPIGFIDSNVIYGIAKESDIVRESSGKMIFPMYKICISDATGKLLKEYQPGDVYITDCRVEDNQITLERVVKRENGSFQSTFEDHITNNEKPAESKNQIVVAEIDKYEKYVQIQVTAPIDTKTLQVLTPKEIIFEGDRDLELKATADVKNYYVYGPYGVKGVYLSAGNAITDAYECAGVVTDRHGNIVWLKGNRVAKNQIMAIKEPTKTEPGRSLAVCLDTMLRHAGFTRDSQALLDGGETVMDILNDAMTDREVLDLSGCNLDSILYYVNQDIPVLAMLENGEAVLITGFNEYNVVVFEPSTGKLYKNGMNDTTEWMEANGNSFFAYR